MTVDEVIIALSSFPPGTQVFMRGPLSRVSLVTDVIPIHVVTNRDPDPGEEMYNQDTKGDLAAFIDW